MPPSSSFSVVQVKKIPLVPALFSAPLIWILKLDNNMELCLFSVPWWFPAPSTEIAHAVCCVAASQAPEICFLFDTCHQVELRCTLPIIFPDLLSCGVAWHILCLLLGVSVWLGKYEISFRFLFSFFFFFSLLKMKTLYLEK